MLDRIKVQCNEEVERVRVEKTDVEQVIIELRNELQMTRDELQEQKEANSRAPSQTIKGLVEKLKNQLTMKEKQNQV